MINPNSNQISFVGLESVSLLEGGERVALTQPADVSRTPIDFGSCVGVPDIGGNPSHICT